MGAQSPTRRLQPHAQWCEEFHCIANFHQDTFHSTRVQAGPAFDMLRDEFCGEEPGADQFGPYSLTAWILDAILPPCYVAAPETGCSGPARAEVSGSPVFSFTLSEAGVELLWFSGPVHGVRQLSLRG